jgi:hypothetical protein
VENPPVENHKAAPASTEKHYTSPHFDSVRDAYSRITGNNWNQSDSDNYHEKVPVEKAIVAMEMVAHRTPVKVNSFRYFVKAILTAPDPVTAPGRKSNWKGLSEGFVTMQRGERTILRSISLKRRQVCLCSRASNL